MSIQENAEQLFAIAEALPTGQAEQAHTEAADLQAAAQSVFHNLAEVPARIASVLGESHGATQELGGRALELSRRAEENAVLSVKLETDTAVLGGELHQLAEQLRTVAQSFMSGQ